jgi:hypothetical protein
MSTTPLARTRRLVAERPDWPRRAGISARASSAATTVTGALVALVLYAAFSDGAAGLAAQARVQVASALIAAAAAALLWTGTLRFAASRRATIGLALLAAFAVWNAISLAWSIAPDQTWAEFNRALTYAIVLGVAIAAGASSPRSIELLARGFLLAVMAVALYGIGQKLLPGVHVSGLFNLDQPQSLPRLEAPLGYWNALALFLAMGIPIALAFAIDRSRSARVRRSSLLALELLMLTIGLTYSRGGVLALALGLAVGIALSSSRLRSLLWLAIAAFAALPPLLLALVDPDLTGVGVALHSRESGGLALALLLVGTLVALWFAGGRLLGLERRVQIGPARARRIGRLLLCGAAAVCAIGVLVVALSSRGLTGTVSHAWHSFTATPQGTSVYSPDRLFTVDSENRWVWWKEAAGAFSDRPLTGWGAGSFEVVQPLYSDAALPVKQPHNVPLQFLAETGLVGAALALGAFALLLAAGALAVRRAPPDGRLLPAALFAVAVMYSLHTLYDWDWDIPGVTLPALVCLGVLVGSSARRMPSPRAAAAHAGAELPAGRGLKALTLVAVTVGLCAVALSGVLPSLAAGKASDALVAAGDSSPAVRSAAMNEARLASKLDPLSDAGLLVEAEIALRDGDLRAARSDLLAAIKRDPEDVKPWQRLVFVEFKLRDYPATLAASRRLLELYPAVPYGLALVQQATVLLVPPSGSATSTQTPLPAAP